MPTLIEILSFVNVFTAAVLAGGQILVLRVIVPTVTEAPPPESVELHRALMDARPDSYLLPAGLIAAGTAALLLFLYNTSTTANLFIALGFLGSFGVWFTSMFFNRRTNRMIARWSAEDVPADYPDIRSRWNRVHGIRTACGTLSFVFFLIAALAR